MTITPAMINQARAKIKQSIARGDMDKAQLYAGIVVHYRIGLGEISVKLKSPARALRKI